MVNDKKITRREFLGALGGMALAAVALKLTSYVSTTETLLVDRQTLSADTSAYGNNAYGGRNA